jgi:hypothetical protein
VLETLGLPLETVSLYCRRGNRHELVDHLHAMADDGSWPMRADDVDPDSTEVVMEIADGQLHLRVEDRWRAERPEDPNHHRVLGAMFWAQRADASNREVRQVALDGLLDTAVVVSVGAIPAIEVVGLEAVERRYESDHHRNRPSACDECASAIRPSTS